MSDKSNIQVLIVDDHAVVREGLKKIIAETGDMSVIGEAENGLDAIKLSRQLDYQVMLLEIALPDRNGIEILKQIRSETPNATILMLSEHREDQFAVRAIKSGASGYVNKRSSITDILKAIRQVAAGQKYVSNELAQELANSISHQHEGEPHKALSDREYQTLLMIASGKSVSDIAKELSLSVKTVSEYRSRVLLKMNLKHNAELTHYAIKNQLVE
jgi:two-component system, NarL family, invasion response regulator UvrY